MVFLIANVRDQRNGGISEVKHNLKKSHKKIAKLNFKIKDNNINDANIITVSQPSDPKVNTSETAAI